MSNPPDPLDTLAAALLERYDSLIERVAVLTADAIDAATPGETKAPQPLRASTLLQAANLYASVSISICSSLGSGMGILDFTVED